MLCHADVFAYFITKFGVCHIRWSFVNTCCLNLLFSVSNINLFSILFLGFIQIQRFVPKGSDFHVVFYSLKNIDFFFLEAK